MSFVPSSRQHVLVLLIACVVTLGVYWPGLSGGWLFDDDPNIVENQAVQPAHPSGASLVGAALSSPASEFKRPLASLSFAANYLVGGLNPWGWKLFNLVVHLLNGMLVFWLARMLLLLGMTRLTGEAPIAGTVAAEAAPTGGSQARASIMAALVAAAWMLLPINLTAVLYVVQRMESMANLLVLLGLIGYVAGRRRMLGLDQTAHGERSGFWLCTLSLVVCTPFGILAKETAVMLPLYACLLEWIVFGFRRSQAATENGTSAPARLDKRVAGLFVIILFVPMIVGLAWLLPGVLKASTWATRDFTLGTRLLSEVRIVVDYIVWTLLPTPHALSFYHDDYRISTGLLSPWTTLASMLILAVLVVAIAWLRKRRPLIALGLALFLGCQLLTATILPLELIYEHRNYFASFGLMLAVVPELVAWGSKRFVLARRVVLAGLLLGWATLTAFTAYAWGNPLRLAEDLAARAPLSPRAQYELGRTLIVYSHYDPDSPFTRLAYPPLERAAALPDSSILPQQALIFMNARMHLPLKAAWWDSMIAKLKARKPGVQDESSLAALTQCAHDGRCDLPKDRMVEAFLAALSHPKPSARLLATYGDYAWNVLGDHALGLSMSQDASAAAPNEPAYHITVARMLAAEGRYAEIAPQVKALRALDIGGRLNRDIEKVQALVPAATTH